MSKLKEASHEFLKASKNLFNIGVSEVKDKLEPLASDLKEKVRQEKVKAEIQKNKAADVKRDTSRRKYSRGN